MLKVNEHGNFSSTSLKGGTWNEVNQLEMYEMQ